MVRHLSEILFCWSMTCILKGIQAALRCPTHGGVQASDGAAGKSPGERVSPEVVLPANITGTFKGGLRDAPCLEGSLD